MNPAELETSAVFRELVDEVRALESKLYDGPNAPRDEQSVLEGYKWIFSILQVAFDTYVWADTANPRFVDIVGPYKKWGGDNADAFYQYAQRSRSQSTGTPWLQSVTGAGSGQRASARRRRRSSSWSSPTSTRNGVTASGMGAL